ncbi:MAG: choice-of-anchor Q domain-containing protein [Verrucomicrobiota bacterium]
MNTSSKLFRAALVWATATTALLHGVGATRTVANLGDGLDSGTLRATIAKSQPGDVIVFAKGLHGTITLAEGGELRIDKDLTLRGPGAGLLTVKGNGVSRVLVITNATVNLSGLTLSGGHLVGANGLERVAGEAVFGAGLLNLHSVAGYVVTVTDCVFRQNSAEGGDGGGTPFGNGGIGGGAYGGALFNNAVLHLGGCSFIENSVTGGVGGAGNFVGGTGGHAIGAAICSTGILEMKNCTLANSHATGGRGGGVPSNLLTVPGAGGNAEGGGVYSSGQLAIQSCTVSGAVLTGGLGGAGGVSDGVSGGSFGGGIRVGDGSAEIGNTLVAGNTGQDAPEVSGTFVSRGFNLVGAVDGSTGFTQTTDQKGTVLTPLNPRLGPLDDHLGPTPTYSLLADSPAVDRGFAFGESVDQRGAPRPSDVASIPNVGDGTDIGAHEWVQPHLAISAIPGSVVVSWSIFTPGQTLWSGPGLTGTGWAPVSGVPAKVGSGYWVTNVPPSGTAFFRLVGP